MASFRGGALAALSLALAGCTQLPGFAPYKPAAALALSAPPATFRLEGRVSVKAGEESFSGGLAWKQIGRASCRERVS
jgi:hypothetical protein